METKKRLVVGVSGASGAILAIRILERLRELTEWETHLILSNGARWTIALETDYTFGQVEELAAKNYHVNDIGAGIASGTFRTAGMVIVPCSMKTLAGVANGFAENLLMRAADVTLKERRPLVLVPRETPLSRVHLRNLLLASEAGAVILPPMVSYYNRPATIEDVTQQMVGRILDVFDISAPNFHRWKDDGE
jgi:4-hydroxy-3-polyprenylbenzoate decarboxylase